MNEWMFLFLFALWFACRYFRCGPSRGLFVLEASIVEVNGLAIDEWRRLQKGDGSSSDDDGDDDDDDDDNVSGYSTASHGGGEGGGGSHGGRRDRPGEYQNRNRAVAGAFARAGASGEDQPCLAQFPADIILVDQTTLLPMISGGGQHGGGQQGRGNNHDGHGGGAGGPPAPPQVTLRALHEEELRPLRQFLLGPLYCPPDFGLTGKPDDPGPRLLVVVDDDRDDHDMTMII